MKTRLTALLAGALLMAGSLCVQAQQKEKGEKADRPRWTEEELIQRQAERMASTLMLDDKTEADFIALYEQYLTDMKNCRDQYREEVAKPERKDNSPLTDEEIVERIEKRFDQQRQLLDIREKYYKDFKKMLTPKQLLRVFDEKRPAIDHHRRWAPNPGKNARRDARRDYRYGCCPWHR